MAGGTRRARLFVNRWSFGLLVLFSLVSLYYFTSSTADLRAAASLSSSTSLSWRYDSQAAAASLQMQSWGRWAVVSAIIFVCSLPLGRFGGLTLVERAGLLSKEWKRALPRWSLLVSTSILALITVFNYYANASTWAARWDFYQLIQFLSLVQLNTLIYLPLGIISGVGEIAKWFAIFLSTTVASFFLIRLRAGTKRAVLESSFVLLLCLFLYELGLTVFCSGYEFVWVTALQVGTPIQWFSNADLLGVSGSGIAFLALVGRRAGASWPL